MGGQVACAGLFQSLNLFMVLKTTIPIVTICKIKPPIISLLEYRFLQRINLCVFQGLQTQILWTSIFSLRAMFSCGIII